MSFIKKYQRFLEDMTSTPVRPDVSPGTIEKPDTTTPSKPSPFKRNRPSVEPATKATAEDVVNRFIDLMEDSNEDIQNYIN